MMLETKELDREKAYCKLVDLILSGKILECTPLSERGLAESTGLGRTPIREAIKDLVREGVLESHPTRGTFVRPVTLQDLREIYQVRFAIESLAVFLAAEHGPTEELSEYGIAFRAALDEPHAFDITQLHDHGAEFHVEIFRNACNRTLLELYWPIRLRFRIAFGLPRHRSRERVLESVQEHYNIFRAIENRDSDEAQRLICDHLQRGLAYRTKLFSTFKGTAHFSFRAKPSTPNNMA